MTPECNQIARLRVFPPTFNALSHNVLLLRHYRPPTQLIYINFQKFSMKSTPEKIYVFQEKHIKIIQIKTTKLDFK